MSNSTFGGLNRLWLLYCVALVVSFIALFPQARVVSSVMALLPTQLISQSSPELSEGFLSRLDKQLVWLVSPPQHSESNDAVIRWYNLLQQQFFLSSITGPVTADVQKVWGEFYYQHRNALIDEATRTRLQQRDNQADWIIAQLFSPFSGLGSVELKHDPMLLVRGSQLSLQQAGSQFNLQQGWLTVKDAEGRTWYMLHGELKKGATDFKKAHETVDSLNKLKNEWEQQYPGAELKVRGSLYYSDYASQQAESDMSRLGTVTVFGVFLLIVWVFRSVRPLFLCLLSVFIGGLSGVVITLLVYGEIHLLTLVMSMSIIGISVDYAIYYLVERMVYGQQDSPQASLIKVRSALLLALGTTVSAYLIMMLAPFPGVRQLALFASVGLTSACLTVVMLFPALANGLPVQPIPLSMLFLKWLAIWRHNRIMQFGLPLMAVCVSIIGIYQLRIDDDVAALQALPKDIVKQDRQIGELTGQHSDQTWYLITGDSAEIALQRLENFLPALEQAKSENAFSSYQRLPFYSQQRQTENHQLVNDNASMIQERLQSVGVEDVQIDTSLMNVTVTEWLDSPVSLGWRLMLLTLPETGETGILLPIAGVEDAQRLSQLAEQYSGVSWVARKAQFDELFGLYRLILSGLLLLAFSLVVVTYLIRNGFRNGLISIVPTTLSLSLALGALGLLGMPLNLFSLLALVLVLGIGINYSIFFSNPKGTPLTSLLSVTVALCTTLLTLGMLVMSSTQAIQGFGLALCVGIFSAWLFSPLTVVATRRHKTNRK